MTKQTVSTSVARQKWLEQATAALRKRFAAAGYTVPDTVRVSCGFPKGSHGRAKAIGQCWASEASGDNHNEIFISPELGGKNMGPKIIGVLAHELAHATVGIKAGHKVPFKQCAEAVGLCGKMTATQETPEFIAWAGTVIDRIGPYPAAALSLNTIKKQTTRMLKCFCETCDYTARVSAKWIEVGTPICPTDEIPMTCEGV